MKILQSNSQIAAELDQLRLLTDNCLAAIAADDPIQLLALMADRQDCMDRLDAARTYGYNYSDKDYEKLKLLQDKDQILIKEAEKLNNQFRQALKSIRSQRFIQAYAPIPGNSGGNIV